MCKKVFSQKRKRISALNSHNEGVSFVHCYIHKTKRNSIKTRVSKHTSQSDLLRQFQLGAVVLAVRMKAHEVRHGRIQEVQQRGRQDGHVDVLPLEWEH